ncbi:SPFH domain-containing protein [Labrys sp. ZIDIC5]|uniref:SPFH domain-containing protein n=1 Tax=Labrys sedimenti TaxID=3106036 RepID=UPI002ACA3BE8|nr:SPFH domain-containing protein [Labrys sp. ZIDIC5]MDZ5449688.1 SPFH domain-containing protein [Labrys sp. ZIDIC5]
MGILDFISKQFIDVIQWTAEEPGLLAYRFPMSGMEIQNGAQLVVRETQKAAFFNEGKIADIFGPGTYTLTTQTLPVLTYLKNWDKFFESPFKSDVYFFDTKDQIDRKWGTTQPLTIRDKEYGPIRIRAFGNYSYAIGDVGAFWSRLVGTAERCTSEMIEGQLRGAVLTAIASTLGQSNVAFIDMAANQEAFSQKLAEAIRPALRDYGIDIKSFYVQSLSLPEELQRILDKASSMNMLGDLNRYAQFQTAESIPLAAENPGGLAGAGAGLGAGMAIGQAMAQGFANAAPAQAPSAPAAPAQPAEDPIQLLEKLGGLLAKGILTQQEFDAKKAELLSRIK